MLLMTVILIAVFFVFSFFFFALKKRKPFLRAFLAMAIGLAALFAVNVFSGWTGVYVPVTRLTLLTSVAGGIPGVALIVLLMCI